MTYSALFLLVFMQCSGAMTLEVLTLEGFFKDIGGPDIGGQRTLEVPDIGGLQLKNNGASNVRTSSV